MIRFDLSAHTITLRRPDGDGVLNVHRYGDKGIVIEEPTARPDLLFHASGRSASASTIVFTIASVAGRQ